MIVLRVLWIGHGVEEPVVAGEAADTFGRAFAGDPGQSGIELAGDGISDPADSDFVFPAVAKIIDVVNGGAILGHGSGGIVLSRAA